MTDIKILLQTELGHIQLPVSEIILIRFENEKCDILTHTACHTIKNCLCNIAKNLPNRFFNCHRTHIVNLDQLKEWNTVASIITLEGGHQAPVSARAARKLNKYFREQKNDVFGKNKPQKPPKFKITQESENIE